jgi:hypothetical protein
MLLWRDKANLWTLILPPSVWALHFLFCYVAAALACAKGEDLDGLRTAIAGATMLAAGLIVLSGAQAWRHWGFGSDMPPHDAATDEDRQHFLALSTLLVCALSLVSVIFVALPALFVTDCR